MAFDAEAFGSGGGGGGDGGMPARYLLRHYGPMDLSLLFSQVSGPPRRLEWTELHPLLHAERVDAFDARNHTLPEGCANTLVTDSYMIAEPGSTKIVGIYSYGHIIDTQAAQGIARTQLPQATEDDLRKHVVDGNLFVSSQPFAGLSAIYGITIAVLQSAAKARPTSWRNPAYTKLFPNMIHM